ncbi:Aldo/keto reductase [Choiromyces venosus 120613-1]|uniref:Aldo/keto reductase n=1 Tax=Choiromyces venosus 120613-1 TaxID=1336337 RepID=A0A3N4JQX6_9PEZI|nr:Aldo/keto reductase [Choiromyces venosus 120613-1]
MPAEKPKLSTLLPPIIIGGAVYNTQMNPDPSTLPVRNLLAKAFSMGINCVDTSPYYGPSELLIGDALIQPAITKSHPRSSYIIMTKAGRIAEGEFDYSPTWIRKSVRRSCERLHTDYLDVVFCHDVEFVTPDEVIGAVRTLFELAGQGRVRYVGISGYPHKLLAELAVRIRKELGRPLDVVQSYCHMNLQNSTLLQSMDKLKNEGGVDTVVNASPLSMKLLTGTFPGSFHPAPEGLRDACARAAEFCKARGETLPRVAMRWVFANWKGATLSGVSYLEELEDNIKAYRDVTSSEEEEDKDAKVVWGEVDEEKVKKWEPLWKGVQEIFGEWKDYSWDSPPRNWVVGKRESKL